jgi:hypothetical protein
MKITLKRSLQLKSAAVYLRLKTEEIREEIKEFLNGNIDFPDELITGRVVSYLKNIKIYNSQNQLTSDGIKARDTGKVRVEEEGKYQIWYTQNDPLFKNNILFFKRVKPEEYNPNLEPIELDFTGKTFTSLPIKEKFGVQGKDKKAAQDSFEFSIRDTIRYYELKNDTTISCTWIWNDVKNSEFIFSGKFETIDINKSSIQNTADTDIIDDKPVDLKIDLKQYIPDIIGKNWNDITGRCKIKIEDIDNDDTYNYFEYSGNRHRDGYDSCEFIKLPVEPYNYDEAALWRDKIINMELRKKYIHPDDFSDRIIMLNQKEGFTAYYDQLDVPDMSRYIEKLDPGKKSDRVPAYWHLTAPLDLFVGIPQPLKIDHFSLSKGDNISFEGLAAKFGTVQAEKIFYYDKYVAKYYQQRSVSTFLSCFGVSNLDICIITDTKNPNYDNYLAKNKPDITVMDISSVYLNTSDAPHDRFIIFKSGGDLIIWTSTNSTDFIRFNTQGEIPPNTSGSIQKSVTFTKVRPDVLGTRLKEFILRG